MPATKGNVPKRTKMTAKIQPSGQRRGRVTEDRERSVGGEIIPDSAHHREKSVGDKTIPASTHPPFHPSPPFHSPAQDQRGGEETASRLTHGPERRRREGEGVAN